MNNFNYFQPTEILFGKGRLQELGAIASRFGNRALLVTTPEESATKPMFNLTKNILKKAGIKVEHFSQVQPNPTIDNISEGAKIAADFQAELIIGIGGGSSMDSAKAIAVEAIHEGTSWDYLFYRDTQPTEKTLPVIAISTTSGTGSQVTQVAVVTNTTKRDKSAIYHSAIFPKVCLIDPELMLSVPKQITASTGFDAFCHAFESMLHPSSSPYVNLLAEEAIRLIVSNLPPLLEDLQNLEKRASLALADTYAGLCIANAGVTLPHGVGMAISGMFPHIKHGESLATIYPAFTKFTFAAAIIPFAKVGRILNSANDQVSDEIAAENCCKEIGLFMEKIGMKMTLKDLNMPENEIPDLAKASMVLPDYKGNPKVASEKDMLELIKQTYFGI